MSIARAVIAAALLVGGCELLEPKEAPGATPPPAEETPAEPAPEESAEPEAAQAPAQAPEEPPEARAQVIHEQLAASNIHTCAIKSGQVRCWGRLGRENFFEPQKIASQSAAVEVSSEGCVLGNNGDVSCWGDGEGTTLRKVEGLGRVTTIGSSSRQTCAVLEDGTVSCWKNREAPAPLKVDGISGVVDVAVGTNHACALRGPGDVVCWGRNDKGQLARSNGLLGGGKDEQPPARIEGVDLAVEIAAGQNHTCARLEAGNVMCWGDNEQRQSGAESGDVAPPTFVAGVADATAIVMGLEHTCAVVEGSLRCWGNNEHGQLGAAGESTPTPVTVEGIADVVAGDAGFRHTCVTTKGADVKCFGDNDFGQLGVTSAAAVVDAGIEEGKVLAVGGIMVCAAVGEDGRLDCRGTPHWEEIKPKEIADARGIVEVAAGQTAACAVDGEGKATCYDFKGNTYEPVPKQALQGISADSDKFCALTKRRELFCWQGGRTEGKKSPLGKVGKVAIVTAAGGHRCMADTRGKTFCFGSNDFGQMGTGRPGKDEGIAFPKGLGVVKELDSGSSYTCARNSKNRIFCWGHRQQPERKPTELKVDGAVQIATADDFGCARTEAGKVHCWGINEEGQLGDGTRDASETPVEVQGLDRPAVQVSAAFDSACALLDNGKVTCWGRSPAGKPAGSVVTVEL